VRVGQPDPAKKKRAIASIRDSFCVIVEEMKEHSERADKKQEGLIALAGDKGPLARTTLYQARVYRNLPAKSNTVFIFS
jgi:hypothetical protein